MKTVKFKNPTLVKYSSGLNVRVEADKKVKVEEEFLKSLKKDEYKEITSAKKKTKQMVSKHTK
jgi:hypothetical protein